MNQKKNFMLFLITFVFVNGIFAQSRLLSTQEIFNNDRLNITRCIMDYDAYGNRSYWVRGTFVRIQNKTNFEMVVTVSYNTTIIDSNGREKVNRDFNNRSFTLRPGSSVDVAEYTDGFGSNPTDMVNITNFRLINFKVNEQNYEIPW